MRVLLLLLSVLLLAASGAWCADADPEALREAVALRGNKKIVTNAETQNLRLKVLKEAAYALGVQTGAKWRNETIADALERQAINLDTIYAFRMLLIQGQILPPVLVRADSSMEMKAAGRSVVKTGTSYKIIQDARFVSVPPTWRDYFTTVFSVSELAPNLYPRTSEEIDVWDKEVRRGWALGVRQADNIFEISLRKLTRDMCGLILFRELAEQGFVSLPQVATGRYAVRVGDKTLDLNQTSFTIIEDSRFQREEKWAPFQMSP